eukprot:TRINITY_DN3676_c0_g1_i4.p2 TRINITY_DN3676_c0_g1~~TRINITY_DN3676_c0_g1_i4.p2  ORF type:complete len:234 (-),score=43.99 TRINITY_DN3676_c0_g1_i4:451-1152(-)
MTLPKKARLNELYEEHVEEAAKKLQEANHHKTQETKKNSVRVWWGPTNDEAKGEYGGAYWPAVVLNKKGQKQMEVKYDNGETEVVNLYDIYTAPPPVQFGRELQRLQRGEFCEVSNESETDPCAWFGRIEKQNKRTYLVAYPFHDGGPELVQDELLRRARIFDEVENKWQVIRPLQEWEVGSLCSPRELYLVDEEQVEKVLMEGKVLKVGFGGKDSPVKPKNLKFPIKRSLDD